MEKNYIRVITGGGKSPALIRFFKVSGKAILSDFAVRAADFLKRRGLKASAVSKNEKFLPVLLYSGQAPSGVYTSAGAFLSGEIILKTVIKGENSGFAAKSLFEKCQGLQSDNFKVICGENTIDALFFSEDDAEKFTMAAAKGAVLADREYGTDTYINCIYYRMPQRGSTDISDRLKKAVKDKVFFAEDRLLQEEDYCGAVLFSGGQPYGGFSAEEKLAVDIMLEITEGN